MDDPRKSKARPSSRFLRRERWDKERAQELETYLAHEIDDNIARGMSPEEAKRAAHRRLGNATRIREEIYRINTILFLDTAWQDFRCSLRGLRKDPLFSVVAILTLALGIGANSAMFALADAALIRQLPFPQADRLVVIWESQASGSRGSVNPLDFLDWSERNRSFEAIAAMTGGGAAMTGPDGAAEPLPGHAVTSGFFDVLGVQPIAGRTFQPVDEGPEAAGGRS